MENKYYTPEIEEFHVGFEYEYREDGNGKWKKEVFKEGRGLSYAGEIDDEEVRVKHLDREDIESLGFKLRSEDSSDWIIKSPDADGYDGIYLSLGYDVKDWNVYISNLASYEEHECYFQGHIKNKSELKRLLKQLGV